MRSEELAKLTKLVLKNEVRPSAEQSDFATVELWCRGRRPRRPISENGIVYIYHNVV